MLVESSLSCLASGFSFLEGPVWIEPGSALLALTRFDKGTLLFSDISGRKIYAWSDGEIDIFREKSRAANGNTLDADGSLLTCEHDSRRVTRTSCSGTISVVAERFAGKRLNSPNDVVVSGAGHIFFTDPPYGVADEERELNIQGVYCVDPVDATLTLMAEDFVRPNGIAFSPADEVLYVADTERSHVRAMSLTTEYSVAADAVFCDVERPDGLRVDADGNLFVAAMEGVEVFDPKGAKIAELKMPVRPANLEFGGAGMRSLFICARHSLYRVETQARVEGAHGR